MRHETALDWLSHSADPATRASASGRRVGIHDVTALRATTATFADLDNRYGGGHARRGFVQFLANDVREMLDGRYGTGIGRLHLSYHITGDDVREAVVLTSVEAF